MSLKELCNLDGQKNLPFAVEQGFRHTADYTDRLTEMVNLLSNKVILLDRKVEMNTLSMKQNTLTAVDEAKRELNKNFQREGDATRKLFSEHNLRLTD